jgi:hypothetical protein
MGGKGVLRARQAWLFHVHGCRSCPADLCAAGRQLAYAVAVGMAPEEEWPALGVQATPSAASLRPFPWAEKVS